MNLNISANNIPSSILEDSSLFQGIYQDPTIKLPTDFILDANGNPTTELVFTPSQFNGPKSKSRRFHNFPRFGFTNDITSLTSFVGGGGGDGQPITKMDVLANRLDVNVSRLETILEEQGLITISSSSSNSDAMMSENEYTSQDANDYIKGIAAVSILIFAIYLIWAIWLLLLRVGRMDCCFRLCRPKSSGTKGVDDDGDDGDDEEGTTNGRKQCCCYTCHEYIAVKGGCCTRNIFCGWMSGRAPKMPTRESLTREQELKESSLIKSGIQSVGNGVNSVVAATKRNTEDDEAVAAETGVPTNVNDEMNKSASTSITDEYIIQRQESTRRTHLILRIIFLISSVLVLIFSSVLLVEGWKGINNIVDSSKDTLGIVENQAKRAMDGIEEYIKQNEEMKVKRNEFLDKFSGGDSNEGTTWCPAAERNEDGKVEITLSLARLLLRGNLIKLAFVDEEVVTDTVEDIIDYADGNQIAQAATTSQQAVTVVTFLDGVKDGSGARDGILGRVLGVKDQLSSTTSDGLFDDRNGRIAELVEKLKTMIKALVIDRVANLSVDAEDPSQRHLQALDSLRESTVTKEGVKYTILEFAEDIPDRIDNLEFRGYDLTQLFTSNITLTIDVPTLTTAVKERLDSTSDYFLDVFSSLYNGLEKTYVQSQSAQYTLDSILPYYYVAVVFISIIMFLTCVFIIGVILAWKDKQPRLFRHLQDHILLPLFIVSGLIMWIFTTVFLALGVVSGDFCVNNPDIQVNKILDQTISGISKIAFNFAFYYVNNCPAQHKPKLMEYTADAINGARSSIGQLFALLGSLGARPLSVACGLETESTVSALGTLANGVSEHLRSATNAVFVLAELLLCRSFSPLYTSLTYDIVCTDFVNMISPMLWSMFIISIFSMIMVTTRVAWHELVEDEVMVDIDEKNEGGFLEEGNSVEDKAQDDDGEGSARPAE